MRKSIKQSILLLTISSAFIGLTHAASCGGSCALGGASYDFLSDPLINTDPLDKSISDNLSQPSLFIKSALRFDPFSTNSSLNQTSDGNASQILPLGKTTSSDNIVKLGASGTLYKSMPTLAFTTLRNKF